MNAQIKSQTVSRLGYIDFAKGIAILSVIVGHLYQPPGLTGRVIYSFHMPLFFIVSGYFIKNFGIKKNIISSYKGLLIPYVFGTFMEMVAEIWLAGDASGFDRVKILFLDMIGGFCKDSTALPFFHGTWILWFLPCLFVTRLLFVVIMKTTENRKYQTSIRIILFSVLAFVGILSPLLENAYFPWGLEIAFVSLPFLYSGYLFCNHKIFENKYKYVIAGIGLIIWIILLWRGYYIELALHEWPGCYLAIIEGIIASYTVICFSQLADKVPVLNRLIRWIGRNSLIILLIHNVEIRYVRWESIFCAQLTEKRLLLLFVRIILILCVTGLANFILYLWRTKKARILEQ